MKEKQIEEYLKAKWPGYCIKFPPIFLRGFPDRICLARGAVIVFVELKRPGGGTVSKAQLRWHEKLRAFGFRVEVIDSREGVDALILTI